MMESFAKYIRFLTDFSSVSLSPYCEFLYGIAKVEQWSVETSRSLCTCLLLMDIMRLKKTSVSTHQTPPMGGLLAPLSPFRNSLLGLVDRPEVMDEGPDYVVALSFGVMC